MKKQFDTDYFVTCDIKRSESSPIINQHHICHLMSARANVDMKVMYDNKLCLIYVTKYCTKCEVKSDQLKNARVAFENRNQNWEIIIS